MILTYVLSKCSWEQFTDAIIDHVNKKEGIVFLLWGKPAQTKYVVCGVVLCRCVMCALVCVSYYVMYICVYRCKNISRHKHTIIQASHPSPLGAYQTSEPFMSSK